MIDVSNMGQALAPVSGRGYGNDPTKVASAIRAGDCRMPRPTEYRFEVTYNSGAVKVVVIKAISARAAIGDLRRMCCGLVRFKLCSQRGTAYPW